jgi:hypothetical protein
MQEYNINVFRQSRVLLSLFLFPVILLMAIFIGAEYNSFIFSVLFLVIAFTLIYYYIIGNLKIIIKNDIELHFVWKKKVFFNYKPIKPIKIIDIKTIVLDEDQLLRKIKTSNTIIYINNSKISSKDATKFIHILKSNMAKHNFRIIDSWDEFAENGYLKIAYKINSFVLIGSIIVAVIFIILKGFKPALLSILLLFIPQMILYKKQMKNKIDTQ